MSLITAAGPLEGPDHISYVDNGKRSSYEEAQSGCECSWAKQDEALRVRVLINCMADLYYTALCDRYARQETQLWMCKPMESCGHTYKLKSLRRCSCVFVVAGGNSAADILFHSDGFVASLWFTAPHFPPPSYVLINSAHFLYLFNWIGYHGKLSFKKRALIAPPPHSDVFCES